ncbi:MAG: hypothetical protein EZS28_004510 [Streblomastix strix]|uniref:Uncharacterized protein n=1 Tax=Streblomastix strix TaxID=222440 RepID=A0A5J4WYJ3_9EUKA|nr:MAG: hypothetical protein EZS28_004510 [Streblomastix strix]
MHVTYEVGQEEIIRSSNENIDKAEVYSIISYEDEMYQLKRLNEEGESDKESVKVRKNLKELMRILYFGRTNADEQEYESDQNREIDIERDCGVNDIDNDNEDKEDVFGQQQDNYENDIEMAEIEKRKLIQKGIVPIVLKMLTSADEDVVFIARRILDGLFNIGMKYLQGGEQHPLRQPLAYDGTIDELIKYFIEVGKGDTKQQIREAIAQIIASLYKAYPLPQNSGPEIINQLKSIYNNSQQYIELLADCPDNHDMILDNDYELKILSQEDNLVPSLHLLLTLLLVGSERNNQIMIYALKDKVKLLSYYSYLNEPKNKYGLGLSNANKNDIKTQAQQVLLVMKLILEGKCGGEVQ